MIRIWKHYESYRVLKSNAYDSFSVLCSSVLTHLLEFNKRCLLRRVGVYGIIEML